MPEREYKLLLVDDDSIVLATISRELKNAGFDVLVADSGEQGLKLALQDVSIDLAILDIRLPGISGIELARNLRPIGIPWIFLSAFDDEETVSIASEEGAMGYLVKPVDVARAIPTIITAIKRSRDVDIYIETESRLTGALETANLVNVVVGILMERHRLGRQEAFELIRRKARSEQRKVKDVAEEVLQAWHMLNPEPINKD